VCLVKQQSRFQGRVRGEKSLKGKGGIVLGVGILGTKGGKKKKSLNPANWKNR